MRLNIAMPGLAEVARNLESLGKEVATEIGLEAVRAGAEVLQVAWQRAAPFDPDSKVKSWTLKSGEVRSKNYGHLNQNIRIGKVRPQKESAVVYKVTTGDAFWGYFVEFGTVNMRARPWARPTMEMMKQQMLDVQVDVLRAGIDAAVRRNGPAVRATLSNGRSA